MLIHHFAKRFPQKPLIQPPARNPKRGLDAKRETILLNSPQMSLLG
jgi:hypothetical protein